MHPLSDGNKAGFLNRSGGLSEMIAEFRWAGTSLGPIEGWPAHMVAATSLALSSDLPIVMLWGENGVMTYNDAYAVFAGRRHPRLLGSDVLDGWPEVASFNCHVLDVVLGQGKNLAFRDEHLILCRNGQAEDVFADLDYSPVLDGNGKPAGVFAIVRETTERVRTEQRLRIAQEAGHVGTFEWYPESGTLDVSDEYRRVWGLDLDVTVTADLLVGLLHPDDRSVAGPSRTYLENPLEYAEYRRIDPATGGVRWIARRGEVVSTEGVAARRFVGIAYDITDIKEARRLTEVSESKWRSLFERMNEGFFVGEAVRNGAGRMVDFTFVEMNPAFEVQTGIAVSAASGRTMREVVPGIQDELIEAYAKVVDTGEPSQFEVHVPALGRWFEVRARKWTRTALRRSFSTPRLESGLSRTSP